MSVVDRRLDGRCRRRPRAAQGGVTAVRRIGRLEDRVVPGALEVRVGLVERDQVGERLRVRRTCDGFVPWT